MRRMSVPAFLIAGIVSSNVAFADCAAPYTSDALLEDLGNVETFLMENNNEAAGATARSMEGKIGCLGETLPGIIIGRTYRAIGAGLYVGGSVPRGEQWFKTSIVVDPTFDYGVQDLPEGHTLITTFGDLKRLPGVPPEPLTGKTFVTGTHYVDGKKLTTPTAVPGIPHLYQKSDGTAVTSWLIEGNAFPDTVLAGAAVASGGTSKEPAKGSDKGGAEKAPKPEKGGTAKAPEPEKGGKEPAKDAGKGKPSASPSKVTTVARRRPPEKTPLMIGGIAIIGGSGAVYYMAMQAREQFDGITDDANAAEQMASKTNSLVVASGVVLGVGAGALTWGLVVDANGTPTPGFSVRF